MRVFASILLLELKADFNLFINSNQSTNHLHLPVTYTDGEVLIYGIDGKQELSGTSDKNDQLILTCSNKEDLEGFTTLDIGGGDNNLLVLTRRFFDNCDIEPRIEEDLYQDDDAETSELKVRHLYSNVYELKFEKSGNLKKTLHLINFKRIVDDQGTTLVELKSDLQSVDVLSLYVESYGYDIEALGKL